MDQLGEAANPARGQVKIGKMTISLFAIARENLVSRDGFGSPVPRQPAHFHKSTKPCEQSKELGLKLMFLKGFSKM